ncbi:DUF6538 domain-containing protein [Mesorhizobium huakuii]|uniref:DUF6538 domain-containing protein n=1 Tax=Mesorhizobium huakuii TaxID=28104 RepID=UPI001FD5DBD1|nr:DUF6538 domain-containing protein [Mesorhizobium huakuii]
MELMTGRVRNLLNRDGRYFARLVVPKELRPYIGKAELRKALGPDYRTALKMLPGAVAVLQHEIALGERRAVAAGEQFIIVGRYPLLPPQIASRDYQNAPWGVTGVILRGVTSLQRRHKQLILLQKDRVQSSCRSERMDRQQATNHSEGGLLPRATRVSLNLA